MPTATPSCVVCDVELDVAGRAAPVETGRVRLQVDACWRHEELIRLELDRVILGARSAIHRSGHVELRCDEHPGDIRAWAKHQGISVSPVGPLSPRLVTAYRQMHGTARADDAPALSDRPRDDVARHS